LRYLRHLKRKRKRLLREIKLKRIAEQKQMQEDLREHVRQLKIQEREKELYEKDRQRKEKEEVKLRLKEQESLREDIRKDEEAVGHERKQQEKALLKRKRRRLLKYLIRIQARNFIRSVRYYRPSDTVKYVRRNKEQIVRFLKVVMNSTVMFMFSYLTLFLLTQLMTVLAARLFHYPTILYYNEVYFNISVEDWYHDSVKTIFSAGPLAALFAGIVFMIVYNGRKEGAGLFKLFFLWGFLHGVSMFFGAMLVGTLFEKGIGHVISWMYIMDTGKVLYSIISIFMLVLAGLLATKPFLISANTYNKNLTRHNRRSFIWAQVILPYLLGTFLLMLLRMPVFMFYETFVTFTIALSLLPLVATYSAYTDLYFEEEEKKAYVDWRFFLMLVTLILIYRGVLNFGINIPA
jgi:hypothetical protein